MKRKLEVITDKETWPKKNRHPLFPATFKAGRDTYDLDIPAMLLMVGYLTTPISSTGVSLSEFWAWIRYFAAISQDNDMKITKSFSDLDAHQKTILSDDFGMGVSMLYLREKLEFSLIVDGRYFLQRYAAGVGATGRKNNKRGPNKTPDFVALDVYGNWHIVECKGTQSGSDYRDRQLGNRSSGGISQKMSIIFPQGHTGQRLACGLSIGIEEKSNSTLKIVDPEPEEPTIIKLNQLEFASDAAIRGVLSKFLRITGLEASAEVIASPMGKNPYDYRPNDINTTRDRRREHERINLVDERNHKASEELRNRKLTPVLDKEFSGAERTFILPRDIYVNNRSIRKIIVKQGINEDFLNELKYQPTIDTLIQNERRDWAGLIGKSTVESDDFSSRIKFGDMFYSELILE